MPLKIERKTDRVRRQVYAHVGAGSAYVTNWKRYGNDEIDVHVAHGLTRVSHCDQSASTDVAPFHCLVFEDAPGGTGHQTKIFLTPEQFAALKAAIA